MILIEEINRYGTIIYYNHDIVVVAKSCGKCKEVKENCEFHKTPATAIGGTVATCRSCLKEFHHKHYRKNTRVYLTNYNEESVPVSRECSKCKVLLNIDNFYKHKKGRDGYNAYCIPCTSVSDKVYRTKNIDKIKARSNSYYRNNKEKVSISNSVKRYALRDQKIFKKNFEKELYVLYKHVKELNKKSDVKLVVDHVVPLIHPNVCGLHYPENLQVLDDSTNCSKGNKWDGTYSNQNWELDWKKSRKKITNE